MTPLPRKALPAIVIMSLIVAGCTSAPRQARTSSSLTPQQFSVDPQRSDGTTFDPCRAFSSGALTKWGVDPKPYAQVGTPAQPARGCEWKAPDWDFTVLVANKTIADYVRDQGARELPVAGRTGAIGTGGPDTCYVTVPAQRASVSIGIGITSSNTAVVDPCAKATAIAADVVTYLPPPG